MLKIMYNNPFGRASAQYILLGDAYLKQQLVNCNEEETNGQATDEGWDLHVD